MSRVLAVHAPPKSKGTLDTLWQGAADLVRGCEQAGMLNQALIELGATICKPREPSCGDCPVKSWCTAYSIAQVRHLHLRKSKTVQTTRQEEQVHASLPDIEDPCTLCVSIPRSGSATRPQVTAYPMAVVRKKQREETDAVFVLEWRSTDEAAERLFLLVKRPDSGEMSPCLNHRCCIDFLPGLLAGLHEFPTMESVSSSQSDDNKHLGSVITRYIENGSQILESPRQPADVPHVAKVHPVGDVVHVFSHIRKTYRVSWVVLTGTGGPPALRAPTGAQPTQKKSTRTKKVASVSANNGGDISPPHSAWIKLSDVEHAK